MKIISILKKSIILLSLMPILSLYAYGSNTIANRDEGRGNWEQNRPAGGYGGEGARGFERGYNRGENNGGRNSGENPVIIAPQNPYNNQGYNPYAPPPPQQDYENPDL